MTSAFSTAALSPIYICEYPVSSQQVDTSTRTLILIVSVDVVVVFTGME